MNTDKIIQIIFNITFGSQIHHIFLGGFFFVGNVFELYASFYGMFVRLCFNGGFYQTFVWFIRTDLLARYMFG
jgi:hypothetical protein